MSYFRKGMGDVITSPRDVDPTLFDPNASNAPIDVTGPKRIPCDQFPEDHPFRRVGAACGPSVTDWLKSVLTGAVSGAAPTVEPEPAKTNYLPYVLLAGAGGLAYYIMTSKKRP